MTGAVLAQIGLAVRRVFGRAGREPQRPRASLAESEALRAPGTPVHVPGSEPGDAPPAVRALLVARALSVIDAGSTSVTLTAAADVVAAGYDGPAVIRLASLYGDVDRGSLHDALVSALLELGWDTARMTAPEAATFCLRARSEHLLAGRLGGRELGEWVAYTLEWSDPAVDEVVGPYSGLDVVYEEFHSGRAERPDPVAIARAFLLDTDDPSPEWRSPPGPAGTKLMP